MQECTKKMLARQRNAVSAKKCRKRRAKAIDDANAKAVAVSKKYQLLLNLIEAGSDKEMIAKARIVDAAETLHDLNLIEAGSEARIVDAAASATSSTTFPFGAECDLSSLPPLFLLGEHAAHEYEYAQMLV